MTPLDFDRCCAEIVDQTALLTAGIEGADLTAPVPSCPGWNLGQLLRHLGGGHRWAETTVRTRATQPPSDDHFRDLSRYTDEDPGVLAPWLAEGAARLAQTLRAAGPDAEVWTPVPGETPIAEKTPVFWARRFMHETLIHRADATLAVGEEFTAAEEVAIDAIDEWMELGSLPQMLDVHPQQRELLGPGRTLHFHATDTAPEASAEWVVDLTGDTIVWRRAHEKAAVAARGTLTDLLLTIYRRLPVEREGRQGRQGKGIEVLGDAKLLDFWLERVSFG
jgi:uncharacterized protein (TIGR03083 family)